MKVDKELIEHVANVARLKLTNEEIKEFLPQLKEILKAFEELQQVNTDKTKPSYHPIELKNAMREDIPKACLPNEQALKNTQHKNKGYFKGPKVV